MSTDGHDLTHAREAETSLDSSPFADVQHPARRLFLEAFAELGTKTAAAEAVGVSRFTTYSPAWQADKAFTRGLEVAERIAADKAEAEAWRRGVEGIRKYRFSSKTDQPLRNPDRCDHCGGHRKEHVKDSGSPEGWGPHPDRDCPGFEPAPYYEVEHSDATLLRLLEAYRGEKFSRRVTIGNGHLAGIEYSRLPDQVIHQIVSEKVHPFAAMMNWLSTQEPALIAAVSEEWDDDEGSVLDAEIVPSSHAPAQEEAPEEEPDGGTDP